MALSCPSRQQVTDLSDLLVQNDILQEQLNYYRARAQEYDASLQPSAEEQNPAESQEWKQAVQSLHALGSFNTILELAGGTGIWSKELAQMTTQLTVLDGSPEMLDINRAKLNDSRVRYECADLFQWEPASQYDLVFFAFWLSHVPPNLVESFLGKVQRAVAPGGYVFIMDEPENGRQLSGPVGNGMYQRRTVQDGRIFNIVKVYYDPLNIQRQLSQRGFAPAELTVGDCFFHLISKRLGEK